jgi:hypothetical protein
VRVTTVQLTAKELYDRVMGNDTRPTTVEEVVAGSAELPRSATAGEPKAGG